MVREFSLEKAAQVAATFVALAPNHRLNRLKLMKLLFLADRTAFAQYGMTITGDKLVVMDQEPVLSGTLDAPRKHPPTAQSLRRGSNETVSTTTSWLPAQTFRAQPN